MTGASKNFLKDFTGTDTGNDPGGYIVYWSDGDVPFFRASFLPIISRAGSQVVKACQKGKFC